MRISPQIDALDENADTFHMPVWGQCDKRMLLGALCPVQLGYEMA